MRSRLVRIRSAVFAVGMSALLLLLSSAVVLAEGGGGPFPK